MSRLGDLKQLRDGYVQRKIDAQQQYLLDNNLVTLRAQERHCDEEIAKIDEAIAHLELPRRVQQYLQSWAARMDEPIDDEFDMPSLLRGDEQTLQPLPAAQPAPPADPRRARLQNIRQKREAYTEQKGDYQRKEGDVVQAVSNVRERLKDVQHGVLLGQPGSGKSWTLRRLMVDALNDWREVSAATRIPVFVPLNSYDGDVPFAAFVQAQMGDFAAYYEPLLNSQRLLLLCDALNEMPNQAQTLPLVKDFLKRHREKLHFTVSCRVLDYQRQLEDLYPLEKVTLRPLELPDIQQFVLRYLGTDAGGEMWAAMGGSPTLLKFWEESQARDGLERFWDAKASFWGWGYGQRDAWERMHAGAGLIPLCRSPFMASLVCELYEPDAPLPASRGAIFAGFVRKALDDEAARASAQGNPFPAVDAVQEALAQLADAMQRAQATVLPRSGERAPACMAQTALIDAGIAASLLIGDREQVRFAHQLFQEYFAARVLLGAMERGDDPASVIESSKWWEPGVWRETAIILGELVDPNNAAIWLAPYSPELASLVMSENTEIQAGQKQLSARAKAAIVDAAWDKAKATDAIERAAAYRALGNPIINADTREGVSVIVRDGVTLPNIYWGKDISAPPNGKFMMGAKNEMFNPLHEVSLSYNFKMSRYLVTFAQFQTFVQSGEFEDARWWEKFPSEAHLKILEVQNNPYLNHPRDSVSWYQAVAFTRWLTVKYQTAKLLEEGTEIRLPTEQEWEYAARDIDGRRYPYGNDFDATKGNTHETGIGQTSAVGIFPDGASPFGVLDMSGNVFEWCLNDYHNDPHLQILIMFNRHSSKVLRGGSFYRSQDRAAATYCHNEEIGYRYRYGGFRLVLAPPIESLISK